ncbi:hypothetical protein ASPBRDRAFT_26958 [Aspergillus brasiliensis CBS 101740]|uniref:Condensation domain-containing protein n=1 Tax=Aspergillus brasiliensis (strain CBS 101740 / IMI 381727 / IBT 21946) TaxID=767769 RepID=A0A1L9UY56_ASPBC|nr:hypothetical protein ASPBRDRAFT_26958 [Aspergillus brasiliensis CBS 101740]
MPQGVKNHEIRRHNSYLADLRAVLISGLLDTSSEKPTPRSYYGTRRLELLKQWREEIVESVEPGTVIIELGAEPFHPHNNNRDGPVDYSAFTEYAFTMVCHLDETNTSSIQVIVNYDQHVVPSSMAKGILEQFSHLLSQLPKNLQNPLNPLDFSLMGDAEEDR